MTDIEYIKKYVKLEEYDEAINKLNKGIPVQYIVGNVDFYGNEILVNENVLIPRFETEELVSRTLKYINKYLNNNISIVDLGTGSGCIAITLKKELPNSIVDAVDISKEALDIAKKNAINNSVNINFYLGNMLEPLEKKYDCIISNPPYISKTEPIDEIVKNNEPHLALYADNEGLYYYEYILNKASEYLNDKFIIAFEIGYIQGKKIVDMAQKQFKNALIFLEKDLQVKERFVFIINI